MGTLKNCGSLIYISMYDPRQSSALLTLSNGHIYKRSTKIIINYNHFAESTIEAKYV